MVSFTPYRLLVQKNLILELKDKYDNGVEQIFEDTGAQVGVSDAQDSSRYPCCIVTVCGDANQKELALGQLVQTLYQNLKTSAPVHPCLVMLVPSKSISCLEGTSIRDVIEATGADILVEEASIENAGETGVGISGTLEQTMAAAAQIGMLVQQPTCQDKSSTSNANEFVTPPHHWASYSDSVVSGDTQPEPDAVSEANESADHEEGCANIGGDLQHDTSRDSDTVFAKGTSRVTFADSNSLCRCLLPETAVSFVCGKGNFMLRQILRESDADIVVHSRAHIPEIQDHLVDIYGTPKQKDAACRRIIVKLFESSDIAREEDEGLFVMLVPELSVQSVFSAASPSIQDIMTRVGVQIEIEEKMIEELNFYPMRIMGTLEQTITAVVAINRLLESIDLSSVLHVPTLEPPAVMTSSKRVWVRSKHKGAGPVLANDRSVGMQTNDPGFEKGSHDSCQSSTLPVKTTEAQSSNEIALLKALLNEEDRGEVELTLLFPEKFVQEVLVGRKQLEVVAERSASMLSISKRAVRAVELVTVKGTRLANTLAVLRLQEMLIQHDCEE